MNEFALDLDVDLLVASQCMKGTIDSPKKRLSMSQLFHRVAWGAAVRVLGLGASWIEGEASMSNLDRVREICETLFLCTWLHKM